MSNNVAKYSAMKVAELRKEIEDRISRFKSGESVALGSFNYTSALRRHELIEWLVTSDAESAKAEGGAKAEGKPRRESLGSVVETMNALAKLTPLLGAEKEVREYLANEISNESLAELLDEMCMIGALSVIEGITDEARRLIELRRKVIQNEVTARTRTLSARFGHSACDILNAEEA